MEYIDREEKSYDFSDLEETDYENVITLSENQEECVQELSKIMDKWKVALNTSYMGRGKSIMAIEAVRRKGIKNAFMICPSPMVRTWMKYNEIYQTGFIIISYDSLRGTLSSVDKKNNSIIKLKHGFLTRQRDTFRVTEEFMAYVAEGVWIFCDECQKIKSDRIQRNAVMTLCRAVMDANRSVGYKEYSGVYMFSATPFYDFSHCINIFYTMGLIISQLFPETGLEGSGLQKIKELCMEIDRDQTNEIWGRSEIKPKKAEKIAYELCVHILLPAITRHSAKDPDTEVNQTIFYTYEKISDIGIQILKASEAMIHRPKNNTLNITKKMERKYAQIIGSDRRNILSNRSGITHGQITAQVIKIYYIIIPLAERILNEIPNSKVTIFVEYKEPLKIVKYYLEEYGVISLTGSSSLSSGDRDKRIAKFQANNNKYRVLVSICQVGSVGVQFDDKHGGRPRIGLAPLIHSTEHLLQSAGRIARKDTKSSSLFFVCKVDNGSLDDEIEKSLEKTTEKKSRILQETLKNNGVIPPVNFVKVKDMRNKSFKEYLDKAGTFAYGVEEEKEEPKINVKRSTIRFEL